MAKEIKRVAYVGDGKGGYVPWDSLTPEAKDAWADRAAARMGEAVNNYYSEHPDKIPAFRAALGI